MSDGGQGALYAWRYARDEGGMDFLALTPHVADDRPNSQGPNLGRRLRAGRRGRRLRDLRGLTPTAAAGPSSLTGPRTCLRL